MKCFEYCENKKLSCQKRTCKYWIEHDEKNNCTVLASRDGPMTLQEIGEIFGVTRMRICQIEKKILKTLSSQISKHPYF